MGRRRSPISFRPREIEAIVAAIILDGITTEYTEYTEYTEENSLFSVYSEYSVVSQVLSTAGPLAPNWVLAIPAEDLANRFYNSMTNPFLGPD
jgi:hypothetical protein